MMKLFAVAFFLSFITMKLIGAEKIKLCFHVNELNDRGGTLAVYEYAHYNEILLNNTSAFVLPNLDQVTKGPMHPTFVTRFGIDQIHLYDSNVRFEMMATAAKNKCELLYVFKAGNLNGGPSFYKQFSCKGNVPTLVHGVFGYERHGTVMAMVSENQAITISEEQTQGNRKELLSVEQLRDSWVPHMVVPPLPSTETSENSTTRHNLGIQRSSLVFCAHGGKGSFNLHYARQAVCKIALTKKENVHFIFLGIAAWHNGCHERNSEPFPSNIHFLPGTASTVVKDAYFGSCDLMLHGRSEGETFGLAVAEMSVRNKPVITFKPKPGESAYDVCNANK